MRSLLARVAIALALLIASLGPVAAAQGSFCMPTTGTVSGLTFAQDVNAAFGAFGTLHSGATDPTNSCSAATLTGQMWLDTSTTPAKVKLYDGTVDQVLGAMDTATGVFTPPVGGGATSVGSASTADLWSVAPGYVTVTGTTTINKLAGSGAVVGTIKWAVFAGALTLTYNSTQLITPSGANITTAAGDVAVVVALGGGNVRVVNYMPASGKALVVDQQIPTAHIDQFLSASCPTGFVDMNGGTIGDAVSGASIRANADTFALFASAWSLDPTAAPIFTSAGGASTRGASAAADYAAHKRLTIPDARGQFLRGLDNGRGVDTSRILASSQAFSTSATGLSATSTFTGTAMGAISPSVTLGLGGRFGANHYAAGSDTAAWASGDSNWGSSSPTFNVNAFSPGTPAGSVSTSVSGSAETRPANVAALTCTKL